MLENLHEKHLLQDGILNQFLPNPCEMNFTLSELDDPLGAEHHKVTKHLVHQYKNRVLFLTTSNCLGYCRYCFRKNFTSSNNDFVGEEELSEICRYLASHGEIQEILFSGGDPLALSDEKLENLILKIRKARPDILIRICTRALFYNPERFTESLLSLLKKSKPLWVIPHINHFYEIDKEISPVSVEKINEILESGISMQSQTVLLHGINDDVETLATLFENLTKLGIKPGYLFQTDLAKGTAHFRVPMERATKLYSMLRLELSGLSLPVFAVDLPGGGGKFNLLQLPESLQDCQVRLTDTHYEFTKSSGKYFYPRG